MHPASIMPAGMYKNTERVLMVGLTEGCPLRGLRCQECFVPVEPRRGDTIDRRSGASKGCSGSAEEDLFCLSTCLLI
jgi:hypothetical protein